MVVLRLTTKPVNNSNAGHGTKIASLNYCLCLRFRYAKFFLHEELWEDTRNIAPWRPGRCASGQNGTPICFGSFATCERNFVKKWTDLCVLHICIQNCIYLFIYLLSTWEQCLNVYLCCFILFTGNFSLVFETNIKLLLDRISIFVIWTFGSKADSYWEIYAWCTYPLDNPP